MEPEFVCIVIPYEVKVIAGLFATALVGVFSYFYYCYTCYLTWENDFGSKRVSRRQMTSPSNKEPPEVIPWESNRINILMNADNHPDNFDDCEILNALQEADAPDSGTNPLLREYATRSCSLAPRGSLLKRLESFSQRASIMAAQVRSRVSIIASSPKGSLSKEQASELNMDHVYVPLSHYLWAMTWIGPQAMYLWVTGLAGLVIRQYLCKIGILQPIPHDPAEVVARLCLKGTMAIHYYAMNQNGKIAGFFFANFPVILADGGVKVYDLLAIEIDLETKKMVKAKLDDKQLTAKEALILCWFNTIAMNHVKLHSLANWGINNEPDAWENDRFVAQNSLVTIMYNYFGYTCFARFMGTWANWGILSMDCSPAMTKCFNLGIEGGIWSHPNIRDLCKHSELVNFITKVRSIFMSEFGKHKKKSFPGVHGEALFVGTVMHSLDHTIMDLNLKDPMWLDVDHPEFGLMAEIGRVVKVGFVKDVPGLIFHRRFKGSNHPFYESVYAKAAKINKFMADNMDTCIVK